MTVGDNRQHGGNAGYDDQVDVYYTWDSTVPNHANIKPGDRIALGTKTACLASRWSRRSHARPRRRLSSSVPPAAWLGSRLGKASVRSTSATSAVLSSTSRPAR